MALSLGVSRREADALLEKGDVLVNGERARMGHAVGEGDVVTHKGAILEPPATHTYLLLNKPVGYVCSRRQQGNVATIYSLLPHEYHRLKTVGRLDKDSSGLLLLTDDGDLAHQMTHPKYSKEKIYEVRLDKALTPQDHKHLKKGVILEDGPSTFDVQTKNDARNLIVTMHEGRNRQIRRTFQALGYKVTKLHRTHFGPYDIKKLERQLYMLCDKLSS